MMFLKPTTSYIVEGQKITIPKECAELHHEVELGKQHSRVDEGEETRVNLESEVPIMSSRRAA